MGGTGSPVDARQGSFLYTLVIFIVIGVVVLSLLGIIILKIREKRSSQSWVDGHKDLPTNKKNIKAMAKIANLTQNEASLLWVICHSLKAKNIEYLYKDYDAINELFKTEYDRLMQKKSDSDTLSVFFSLRYKLEKAHDIAMYIKSSSNIQEGQVIVYTDKAGLPWELKISNNTKQGFFVEIPPTLSSSGNKPDPLEKISIQFMTQSNISYTLDTRVVRYEIGKNGNELMFCSQTNILKPLQRRMSKRMNTDKPCKFSAVKVENSKKKSFTILENRYDGKLNDISPTGCSLTYDKPIKKGQFIYVECNLQENNVTAIGEIVSTQKIPNNKTYILHIRFIEIDKHLQNQIYALIYGYLD